MEFKGSFRDLKVWRDAMLLVEHVYKATATFPADERFGLTAQIRRARWLPTTADQLPASSERFHHSLRLLVRLREGAVRPNDVIRALDFFVDRQLCAQSLAGFGFCQATFHDAFELGVGIDADDDHGVEVFLPFDFE
jgi:hypothetical protein